jgi:HK97 family phage portal protein
VILSEGTLWEGSTSQFPGWESIYRGTGAAPLTGGYWASYAEIYRRQLWVAAVCNKLAMGEARLPLKVYEHDDLNRPEADGHPYQVLLRRPNGRQSRFNFWLWTVSTFDVHGEAFWGKIRDPGGRPVELAPLHPTGMHLARVDDAGQARWDYQNGTVRVTDIPQSDLVHFRTFNPDTSTRGMSRLEPLRRTLEFEDAAQRAQSSFWSKSARPGTLLATDRAMSQPALDRLRVDWDRVAGGVDNHGKTVILEEGLKPERWQLTNEEAQYIDARKLNREEVCAVFDVPPPAVHILDRATFSNITEQLRSLYRDTHAPRLQLFESTLEQDLRGARRPGASDPDFGDEVYAEFLLDEVLRGDFEVRSQAYRNAEYMTMAEKRQRENLPFIEGTDRIFVNAATAPLDAVDQTAGDPPTDPAPPVATAGNGELGVLELVTAIQKVYLGVGTVITADEARALLNRAGAGLVGSLPGDPPAPAPAGDEPAARAVADLAVHWPVIDGRLRRVKTLDALDADALVAGVPAAGPLVRSALAVARSQGHTVTEFRQLCQTLAGGTTP